MVEMLRLSDYLSSIFAALPDARKVLSRRWLLRSPAEGVTCDGLSATTRRLAPGAWSEGARITFSGDRLPTFDAHFGGGQRSALPGGEYRRQQVAGAAARKNYWPHSG